MPNLDHTADPGHRETRLTNDLIAWLGTTRPDGRPHLVPVWFVWDGETVLILSQPTTQKVRNLSTNPRVTIALDETRQGEDIVILDGEATLTTEPRDSERVHIYLRKYATLLAEMNWSPDAYLADYTQAILVRPTRFLSW
jgi:PPOX class probable F420-dependent enzyme